MDAGVGEWMQTRAQERNTQLRSRLDAVSGTQSVPDRDDVRIGSARETRGVVLFVDLVKSTQLSIRYARTPDKMLATLNLLIPTMMDAARSYDGGFEKNTGDGVMAYFGMGTLFDDATAATNAVRSAYAMLWATRYVVNPLLKRRGLAEIQITVGADIGDVLLARIGLQRIENGAPLVAVGVAANRAAKIQDKSRPNQARVGEDLYRALPRDMRSWFSSVEPGAPWPFTAPRTRTEIEWDESQARLEAQQSDEDRSREYARLGLPTMYFPTLPRSVPVTRSYRVYSLNDRLR